MASKMSRPSKNPALKLFGEMADGADQLERGESQGIMERWWDERSGIGKLAFICCQSHLPSGKRDKTKPDPPAPPNGAAPVLMLV